MEGDAVTPQPAAAAVNPAINLIVTSVCRGTGHSVNRGALQAINLDLLGKLPAIATETKFHR